MPKWRELPKEKHYKILSAVHCLPQGSSAFINPADAEECIHRGCFKPTRQQLAVDSSGRAVTLTASAASFAGSVWSKLIAQPLGSLPKRELELILLRAALNSGLLDARSESVVETCNVPITRAHAYLTDLALRQPAISDKKGVEALVRVLKDSEVVHDQSYFSIPLHDAALRI